MKKHYYKKVLYLSFAVILICTQFLPMAAWATADTTTQHNDYYANYTEQAASAISEFQAVSVQSANYTDKINTLCNNLQHLYPEEFHDNLNQLNDTEAPKGGLTEREYAMSDMEATLEALLTAKNNNTKNAYLDSLRNDIQEIEIKKSEEAREKLESALIILEDPYATNSDKSSAISEIDSIIKIRYPDKYTEVSESSVANNLITSTPLSNTIEENLSVLSRGSFYRETSKVGAILKKQVLTVIQEDPLLSTSLTDTWTLINIPLIKQENGSYCAPATIQQTLGYIYGSYDSQDNIRTSVGAGPGLQTVLDYINEKIQSHGGGASYSVKSFASSTSFYRWTLRAKEESRPVIFTLKDSRADLWPYPTDGHFTNCCGYCSFTPNPSSFTNGYIFADPFFYNTYVLQYLSQPLDPEEEGQVIADYSVIKYVSEQLHGVNNMKVGAY